MTWYASEPRNGLTRADVQHEIRDFLRSQSARSSYAPKGTPWQSIDLPLVTSFPLNPQDRDEANLLNATSDEVTRWVYVAKTARWLQIGGAPIGVLEWTGASDAPTGYVKADGTAISRTTYAGLFALYGTTHGAGNGSTTFNVPNVVNRLTIGAGGTYALGATGGAATVTIATGNLPSHTHSIPNHTHVFDSAATSFSAGGVATNVVVGPNTGDAVNTRSSGATTSGSTGSGNPLSVLNPYIALTPIVRT